MQPTEERRAFRRYASKARATLVPAHDLMRLGIPATVRDASASGLCLRVREPLAVGETLSGDAENPILRAKAVFQARVVRVTALGDGSFCLGCSLRTRFTVRQVLDLRSNQADGWVGLARAREGASR
jgi:hypothetical protein